MIRYIKNKNINKAKWDSCIANAPNRLIYAFSWYLDIVAPGWDALIYKDYESVFPIPNKDILGIKFTFQPKFTQQLGWFGKVMPEGNKLDLWLPKFYKFGLLTINHSNLALFPGQESMKNFTIDLNASYPDIYKGFSRSHKNNINKLIKSNEVKTVGSLDNKLFVNELITNGWFKKVGFKCRHIRKTRRLLSEAIKRNAGVIIYAKLGNEILAGTFFLKETQRIYNLISFSSESGYKKRAQYLILNSMIQNASNSEIIFDFEGSSIEGVAMFYKGFGAKAEEYGKLIFFKNRFWRLFTTSVT